MDKLPVADGSRDGQKRPVYIYRLLTACSIDEKIYQVGQAQVAQTDMTASSHQDWLVRTDAAGSDIREKQQL